MQVLWIPRNSRIRPLIRGVRRWTLALPTLLIRENAPYLVLDEHLDELMCTWYPIPSRTIFFKLRPTFMG